MRQPLLKRQPRDSQGITIDYLRTLRPFVEKLQDRAIHPDWVERFFSDRSSVVAFTTLCTAAAIACFISPFVFDFKPIGIVLFFLTAIPGSLAYWGVWNLARASPLRGYGDGSANVPPAPSLVTTTYVVYGMLGLSFITFGITAIAALIINYMKQTKARGTYLASHFRWQIRTFWFALLWFVISLVLALTVILAPLATLILVGTFAWFVYRIGRGWRALNRHEAISSYNRPLGGYTSGYEN